MNVFLKKITFFIFLLFNEVLFGRLSNKDFTDFCDFVESRDKLVINKNPLFIHTDYDWTVIGGGVAGIIAVSILLDLGIDSQSILWVDPSFNIGRIGDYYQNVVGNTSNKSWIDFLEASSLIKKICAEDINEIGLLDREKFSTLSIIVKPMERVTEYLRSTVHAVKGFTDSLEFYDSMWHVTINNEQMMKTSKNIILATGSRPVTLDYNNCADVIPLDFALNKDILTKVVNEKDNVAVFGGSHSGILILKYLYEIGVNKIFNFYKNDILYAVDMGSWVLNSANGLKGETASWAKNFLEKDIIKNLVRLKNNEENRKKFLPLCNKIIYAVGYQKNPVPQIINNSESMNDIYFDPETGIIGPRMFGIGIAFPGYNTSSNGDKEIGIGLLSFIKYALLLMPEWVDSRAVDVSNILHMISKLENIVSISLL